MKNCVNNAIMALSLMTVLLGCKEDTNNSYDAKSLRIDSRYKQEIDFEIIGIKIPIKQDNIFIRIDGSVSDIDKHQEVLLKELGIVPKNIVYLNPAENGRQVYLTFGDGKTCSFIWVLKRSDDRLARISIEHEKYHALCRLSPKDISLLSEKIKENGFNIDLCDYDEELAATIVQIFSLHLLGARLDQISGSELTEQARDILVACNIENRTE